MPLSKARDKERKRLSRLEFSIVQPKQAKIRELRELMGAHSRPMGRYVHSEDIPIQDKLNIEIDADGNLIPDF